MMANLPYVNATDIVGVSVVIWCSSSAIDSGFIKVLLVAMVKVVWY